MDARVVLYGGRQITGWEEDGEKFYAVELPGVKEGEWDFRALVVNGRFCMRARLPEMGTFEHLSEFSVLDETNIIADPLLIEFENGVVTFDAQSLVHKLGIQSIDVSDAGPR